ncbi:HD-GYP domain-containing protein [Lysinibacillus sp. fkY74-1]|uniref:HD-GYP domain-containing protein n=1 Tax=Lysinibacillus sphaericus TaxID=1421 RepID=UPI00194120DA|nr:HD-GYP domain-containing protein [Lysinibacillus sphaericus]QPA60616.1 HD-GYP domain-containing protein [Lysinibacillus sphaericus]
MINNLLKLQDAYTQGHSKRVAVFAKILAIETNQYDQDALNKLFNSCLLHDIGKLGIPNKILNKKTSPLTQKEYDVMKTHPQIGEDLLKIFPSINIDLSIIRSHHEMWNGNGYPDGLIRYEIPLSARIVSIADAFDAMTSTRLYRKAMNPKEAYNRIIEGKGIQFDPELVDIFQKTYSSWVKNTNIYIYL